MTYRPVTERDFRKDEFKDADPDDYEFRADGEIVRNDRWEVGMRTIASILIDGDYEIEDVIEKVRECKKFQQKVKDTNELH